MVLKDYDNDGPSGSISPPSEDEILESEEDIQPCEGNLLMVRRLLGSQPMVLE